MSDRLARAAARIDGPVRILQEAGLTAEDLKGLGVVRVESGTVQRVNDYRRLCRRYGAGWRPGTVARDEACGHNSAELSRIMHTASKVRRIFAGTEFWNPRWGTRSKGAAGITTPPTPSAAEHPKEKVAPAMADADLELAPAEGAEHPADQLGVGRSYFDQHYGRPPKGGLEDQLKAVLQSWETGIRKELDGFAEKAGVDAAADHATVEQLGERVRALETSEKGRRQRVQHSIWEEVNRLWTFRAEKMIEERCRVLDEVGSAYIQRWRLNEYSWSQKVVRWWRQRVDIGVVRVLVGRGQSLASGILARFRAALAAFRGGPVEEIVYLPPKGLVAQAAKIINLIGKHVALERQGDLERQRDLFTGACSFCENTITVSAQGQSWHCSCGSGDVIEFVRLSRHIAYEEAVAYLERKLGAE